MVGKAGGPLLVRAQQTGTARGRRTVCKLLLCPGPKYKACAFLAVGFALGLVGSKPACWAGNLKGWFLIWPWHYHVRGSCESLHLCDAGVGVNVSCHLSHGAVSAEAIGFAGIK